MRTHGETALRRKPGPKPRSLEGVKSILDIHAEKIVVVPNGCWVWIGNTSTLGYGRVWHGGRMVAAHRLAYELEVSKIEDGLVLDHLCRNPRCVNPRHVEPVTQRENLLRGEGRGGVGWKQPSYCPRGHGYDGLNTYVAPSGRRDCRTCRRAARRARAGSRAS